MAPKPFPKPIPMPHGNSSVYVVTSSRLTQNIHATFELAEAKKAAMEQEGYTDLRLEVLELLGGHIVPAGRAEDPEDEDSKSTPARRTPRNKTKVEDLPEGVRDLLNGTGSAFANMSIHFAGTMPIMGRPNAEKLVVLYGGELSKTLSNDTTYVVIGKNAGAEKLNKVKELGVARMNEDEFIAFIEAHERAEADKDLDELDDSDLENATSGVGNMEDIEEDAEEDYEEDDVEGDDDDILKDVEKHFSEDGEDLADASEEELDAEETEDGMAYSVREETVTTTTRIVEETIIEKTIEEYEVNEQIDDDGEPSTKRRRMDPAA